MTAARRLTQLSEITAAQRRDSGSKAANLAIAASRGFRVPPGFVVTESDVADLGDDLGAALARAAARIGDGPFAVRSSGAAEDLPDASYAGLYDTVLDVASGHLMDAVTRIVASTRDGRVGTYERAREISGSESRPARMAVLVQQMVRPRAAGVAFTANPLSGRRDEAVVTAVRGIAEKLVSGEAIGEQWLVTGEEARRERDQGILEAAEVLAVARLARDVEQLFGVPQDIEWAIDQGGTLFLIQARPMTALPESVSWNSPGPGLWSRNFRLGEWLPEAMTPLFASWIVPRIEEGYLEGMEASIHARVPFPYAAVNGWYYNTTPTPSPGTLWRVIVDSRGRAPWVLYNALVRVARSPASADHAVLHALEVDWRERLLPRYRRLAEMADVDIASTTATDAAETIDQLSSLAGQYLWFLAIVGGSAWKMEAALTRFWAAHLAAPLEGTAVGALGPQALLRGLRAAETATPAHAVYSLDWYFPTRRELDDKKGSNASPGRSAGAPALVSDRLAAEGTARDVLRRRPRLRARFDRLLEVAQRYAVLREEQAQDLTLGWPALRRCARLLGALAESADRVDDADDIFFLTLPEVFDAMPKHSAEATARRATWDAQRRLQAPITIGKPAGLVGDPIARAVRAARRGTVPPGDAIVGQPASAGRATGRVHVVIGSDDFPNFREGEILVAKATAPAWTQLFPLAAAVVTDGGTLAAHASLVAREYGIPAVVGTGDATARLRTGQTVTVDGSVGAVLLDPLAEGERPSRFPHPQ